ncbi:MAG: hypothetical protein G8345_14300 [Magnetococcales bacterium]|nr:hypothetical protein [Magnetococcales bacterium]NGZ28048.1 hypothetical protein [Magnetococcales bacterium]
MNLKTLLLRQIHPNFIQDGRVSSQAFRPTPKDEDLLSVYHGDLITPEAAWTHFNGQPKCSSVGVMGVSVAECEELALSARPDPLPFPEHAVIDFSTFSKSQIEKKAKQLRVRAEERNWLYQP